MITKTPTGSWKPLLDIKAGDILKPYYSLLNGITVKEGGEEGECGETIIVTGRVMKPLFLHYGEVSRGEKVHGAVLTRIIIKPGASAKIVQFIRRGSLRAEITVEEGGALCHAIVQKEGELVVERKSRLSSGAAADLFLLSRGAATLKEENRLSGERASLTSNQLFLGGASSNTAIIHEARRTRSVLHARGVSEKRLILEGILHILPSAVKSDAAQELHALLATSQARARTSPRLFIGTGDVRCRHAATTRSFDEAKAYYLESRGINKEKALSLLLRAFTTPIIKGCVDGYEACQLLSPFLEQLLKVKE